MNRVPKPRPVVPIGTRKLIVQSFLRFFAMDQDEQFQFVPKYDEDKEYLIIENGPYTPFAAHLLFMAVDDYLGAWGGTDDAEFHNGNPEVKRILREIRQLVHLMVEMYYSHGYQFIWLMRPMPEDVSPITTNILWKFLRRLSRQYFEIVPPEPGTNFLGFDELKSVSIYTGALSDEPGAL